MGTQNKTRHGVLVSFGVLALGLSACATGSQSSLPPPTIPTGPEQVFATPQDAVAALMEANRTDNKEALLRIFGPDSEALISSGDRVADAESRKHFVEAYDTAHKIETAEDGSKILVVGDEDWPLPIPLVFVTDENASQDGWQFDTAAGEQEVLDRRIGRNEINVIKTCRAYVEAQEEFSAKNILPDGTPEYAQRFISRPGKHDGLYWPVNAGEEESPFGPLIAHAQAEGYGSNKHHAQPEPYHGYFYRILTSQSDNAAGGAKSYLTHGHMTKGYALVVFPAKYGDSGIMTFIVNQSGIVFEKNLGPETKRLAAQITSYDPDETWRVARE